DLLSLEIVLVSADVEVIDQFLERTAGAEEEPYLVGEVITSMALGDVVRQRHCCSSDLTAYIIFLEIRQPSCHAVHFLPKFTRYLVNVQVLKRPKLLSLKNRVLFFRFNVVTHLT